MNRTLIVIMAYVFATALTVPMSISEDKKDMTIETCKTGCKTTLETAKKLALEKYAQAEKTATDGLMAGLNEKEKKVILNAQLAGARAERDKAVNDAEAAYLLCLENCHPCFAACNEAAKKETEKIEKDAADKIAAAKKTLDSELSNQFFTSQQKRESQDVYNKAMAAIEIERTKLLDDVKKKLQECKNKCPDEEKNGIKPSPSAQTCLEKCEETAKKETEKIEKDAADKIAAAKKTLDSELSNQFFTSQQKRESQDVYNKAMAAIETETKKLLEEVAKRLETCKEKCAEEEKNKPKPAPAAQTCLEACDEAAKKETEKIEKDAKDKTAAAKAKLDSELSNQFFTSQQKRESQAEYDKAIAEIDKERKNLLDEVAKKLEECKKKCATAEKNSALPSTGDQKVGLLTDTATVEDVVSVMRSEYGENWPDLVGDTSSAVRVPAFDMNATDGARSDGTVP